MSELKGSFQSSDEFLQACLAAGRPWVVMNGDEILANPDRCWFLNSSVEAMAFCRRHLWQPDADNNCFKEMDFHYHPVRDLVLIDRYCRETDLGSPLKFVGGLEQIKASIQQKQIQIPPGDAEDEFYLRLALGLTCRAQQTFSWCPADKIDSYCIIQHFRDRTGTILEDGHSLVQHGVFRSRQEAERQYRWLTQLTPNKSRPFEAELLLLGQYKDQSMELDRTGRPLHYTGFLLSSTSVSRQGKETFTKYDPQNTEYNHLQYFYRFDPKQNIVFSLDETLTPLSNRQPLRSIADENYSCQLDPTMLAYAQRQLNGKNTGPNQQLRQIREDREANNGQGI